MTRQSQKPQEHLFFLATENQFIHIREPYKIRHEMIETKNFVPEAFIIHHFQLSHTSGIKRIGSRRELWMPEFDPQNQSFSALHRKQFPFSQTVNPYLAADEEDDDWDEDDEEWDEDEEDWDEDEEDWDDEEWEDEDDEDADDDEDWDDEDEGEGEGEGEGKEEP